MNKTAGALGIGERVFYTAKLPDYINVGVKNWIEQYLFLTTTHNGLGSITFALMPIRIVSNNTLNAAMNNHAGAIKYAIQPPQTERPKQTHKLMGVSKKVVEKI